MNSRRANRSASDTVTSSRQEEILAVALEMFAENGYRGTSLDAIAQRVGLTRQGVLHYFPSKQRLLAVLLQRTAELGRGELPAGYAGADLAGQLADVVARNRDHPGFAQAYSVLLSESVTVDHPAREHFREHYRQTRERIARSFTERWGDRLPSGLTPYAAATALLALLDGMQQQWLLDREQTDHPGIMRAVLTVLFGTDTE